MLLTLIPLFDENMAVKAYSVFSQRHNFLLNPMLLGSGRNDGSASVDGLELIENMGIETISEDAEIFVPLTSISIFSDVENQCSAPHSRIVFLLDNTIPPVDMYIGRIHELKKMGYRFAIRKLAVTDFEVYREIFKVTDYVFLNSKKIAIDKAKIYFGKLYPEIKLCAGNIDTMEQYEELKALGGCHMFEGEFYRIPVTRGKNEVAPLKINYIELLNLVNSENFQLAEAADIIGHDTALTISLLQMANRMTVNSGITTIRHAAAMLGQRELKKWINTAVVNEMYADKPSEVTRISLLRAKFAENLASLFGVKGKEDELFLMGLFSVLDVILEKTMEEALSMVMVAGDVREALINRSGKLAPVLDFIVKYETADWQEVSRLLLLADVDINSIYDAYVNSLQWYRKLAK